MVLRAIDLDEFAVPESALGTRGRYHSARLPRPCHRCRRAAPEEHPAEAPRLRSRIHFALGNDAPEVRKRESTDEGNVIGLLMVGRLHHRHTRRAARTLTPRALPAARRAGFERGIHLSPAQCAQLTLRPDAAWGQSSVYLVTLGMIAAIISRRTTF